MCKFTSKYPSFQTNSLHQALGVNPLDEILAKIAHYMQYFEVLKPFFARVTPQHLQQVTPIDQRILQGQESEIMNNRFLGLQQTAMRISDPVSGTVKDPQQEQARNGPTGEEVSAVAPGKSCSPRIWAERFEAGR